MFEVGFSEIVLILGLALLVLGPEKLPGLAEKVGRWTGRARAMARQLRTQLEQEVTIEEMAKSRPMQAPKSEPEPAADTAASDSHTAGYHTGPATHEFDVGLAGHDTSVPASMPPDDLPAGPSTDPAAAPSGEPVHTKIAQ